MNEEAYYHHVSHYGSTHLTVRGTRPCQLILHDVITVQHPVKSTYREAHHYGTLTYPPSLHSVSEHVLLSAIFPTLLFQSSTGFGLIIYIKHVYRSAIPSSPLSS